MHGGSFAYAVSGSGPALVAPAPWTSHVERDWSEPAGRRPELLPAIRAIYEHPEDQWELYELCEELVDVEESFQLWRFRHMKTVERIIGYKRGTGGSSGVGFLRAALELTFFPELLDVRTEIGSGSRG